MTVSQLERLRSAYAGRSVFVTGHTGFKGSWLTVWLSLLGARVSGYALAADTEPSLFVAAGVEGLCEHRVADVRSLGDLRSALHQAQPDVIFHLAAQPLVRRSYVEPLQTLETNVIGTANLLEAVRLEARPCAVVVVTSDKCYENREWVHGYREEDPLGGHDVYSASKAAAEIVAASYRRSFFDPERLLGHGVAVATARAGNVIGGGDWAADRLVPDAIAALAAGRPISVRNPSAVRPWQHVLEPLSAYLLLGAQLLPSGDAAGAAFCEAWNFGPSLEASVPVSTLVGALVREWGSGAWEDRSDPSAPHEAGLLRLSVDKAWNRLGWAPRWSLGEAVRCTVEWYRAFHEGRPPTALKGLCEAQIKAWAGGATR